MKRAHEVKSYTYRIFIKKLMFVINNLNERSNSVKLLLLLKLVDYSKIMSKFNGFGDFKICQPFSYKNDICCLSLIWT